MSKTSKKFNQRSASKKPSESLSKPTNKPRTQEKVVSSDSTGPIAFWSRNKLLAAAGLAAVAAVGVHKFTHKEQPAQQKDEYITTHAPQPQPKPEDLEALNVMEITLGNVRFHLSNKDDWSTSERAKLFKNIKNAYIRLKDYFGEEIMTQAEYYECPIIKKPKNGSFDAQVTLHAGFTQQPNGDWQAGKLKSIVLEVVKTDEAIIAHEFVHLFVQPLGVLSQAFLEGHAHAIQAALYGPKVNEEDPYNLAYNPKIMELFDVGLDVNIIEQDYLKGGIQDTKFNYYVTRKWEVEWGNFLKENPEFFKKFYTEIFKAKKTGKNTYSRTELVKVAEQSSPNFLPWYSRMTSMKEMGSTGPERITKAVSFPKEKVIVIVNTQTVPGQKKQGGTPPNLIPAFQGPLQVTLMDTISSKTLTNNLSENVPYFFNVEFKNLSSTVAAHKIIIGGKEITVGK